MNNIINSTMIVSLIFLYFSVTVLSVCEDWTFCQMVRCAAAPPEKCPKDQFLIWDDCGCCQSCSKTPKITPCGICGVQVKCKEQYPICHDNQVTTIDSCGCCKVCRDLLDEGANCSNSNVGVCKPNFKCIDGICEPRT